MNFKSIWEFHDVMVKLTNSCGRGREFEFLIIWHRAVAMAILTWKYNLKICFQFNIAHSGCELQCELVMEFSYSIFIESGWRLTQLMDLPWAVLTHYIMNYIHIKLLQYYDSSLIGNFRTLKQFSCINYISHLCTIEYFV